MSWNDIKSKGSLALADAVRVNNVLRSLDMSGNRVGVRGFQAFASALVLNTTLRHLHLRKTKDAGGACGIDTATRANRTLETLNISTNHIGDSGTAAIASALEVNPKLHTLDLRWNNVGILGAVGLCAALRVNQSLRVLLLQGNQIDDRASASLANAIRTNSSLITLSLDNNQVGYDGAANIATALQVNHTLETLAISRNNILEGKAALFRSLKENSSLQKLTLDGTNLSCNVLQTLAEALMINTSLRTLSMRQCTFRDRGRFVVVANAFKHNSTLIQLDVRESSFNAADWNALALALNDHSGLEILHVDRCRITDDDLIALAKMLVVNRKLLELHLYGAQLYYRSRGAAALRRALKMNRTLRELHVSEHDKSECFKDYETVRCATRLADIAFVSVVNRCKVFTSVDVEVIKTILKIASSHTTCKLNTTQPDSI